MTTDEVNPQSTYYVRFRGKIHGPFDIEKLVTLYKRGQFSRAHEISEDKRNWQSAATLTDFFEPSNTAGAGARDNVYLPVDANDISLDDSASAPPESSKWYYNIGDERHGPISLIDLRQLVISGQITPHDLVWKEGMPDWVPAGNQPEFQLLRMNTVGSLHGAQYMGENIVIGSGLQVPRVSGLAVASLTLGIIGLLLWLWTFGICNILAVVFASASLKNIDRSRGLVVGRGMAISGLVMGIIGLVIWIVLALLIFFSLIVLPARFH